MKHLHTFENFINEELNAPSVTNENEITQIFESDAFVTDKNIANEGQLRAEVAKNVGPAMDKLLKDKGIKYNKITGVDKGRYIALESQPLSGKDLGVMQWGFKEVTIDSFGQGAITTNTSAAGFSFSQYVPFNLHYSYKHGAPQTQSQGSNGCQLFLPGETWSTVWYDIINKKMITHSEMAKGL